MLLITAAIKKAHLTFL